jgi:hypothetical protein
MSKIKKIPVLAPGSRGKGEHYGNPHVKFVRRQTNDQIIREVFDVRGMVRLRVQPAIQAVSSNYYGWHDGSVTVESTSIEGVNMFVERLRKAIIDIATDLKLTVKSNAVIS